MCTERDGDRHKLHFNSVSTLLQFQNAARKLQNVEQRGNPPLDSTSSIRDEVAIPDMASP